MRSRFYTLLLSLGLLLGTAFVVVEPLMAQNPMSGLLNQTSNQAGYVTDTEQGQTGFARVLGSISRFFISMIGVIFLCYTVYGGFLWLTAAGNDDQISKSKNIIRDGIVGIIITFSAATIYILVHYAIAPK